MVEFTFDDEVKNSGNLPVLPSQNKIEFTFDEQQPDLSKIRENDLQSKTGENRNSLNNLGLVIEWTKQTLNPKTYIGAGMAIAEQTQPAVDWALSSDADLEEIDGKKFAAEFGKAAARESTAGSLKIAGDLSYMLGRNLQGDAASPNFLADKVLKFSDICQNYADKVKNIEFLKTDEDILAGSFKDNPSWERLANVIGGSSGQVANMMVISRLSNSKVAYGFYAGAGGAEIFRESYDKDKNLSKADTLAGISTASTYALDRFFEPLPLDIDKGMKTTAGKIAKDLLSAPVKEASTETLQGVLAENLVKKIGINPTQNLYEGWIENFLGGFAGGTSGAVIAGAAYAPGRRYSEAKETALEKGASQAEISQFEQATSEKLAQHPEIVDNVLADNFEKTVNQINQAVNQQDLARMEKQKPQYAAELKEIYSAVFDKLTPQLGAEKAAANAKILQGMILFGSHETGLNPAEFFKQRFPTIERTSYKDFAEQRQNGSDEMTQFKKDLKRLKKLRNVTKPPKAGLSLAQYLKQKGGLKDSGGELKAMDAEKQVVGLVNNKGGLSLDEAAFMAWEAGYIQTPERPEINILLDKLSEDLSGRKIYADITTGTETDYDNNLFEAITRSGGDINSDSPETLYQKIKDYQNKFDNPKPDNLPISDEDLNAFLGDGINFQLPPEAYDTDGKADIDTPQFKNWFGDSKVVNENGEPLVVYHGTKRSDRVGSVFLPERATSGPMAYFTDNKEIAANYSHNKEDTSLTEEARDYKNWYKMEIPGLGKISLDRAWYYLTAEKQNKIREKAPGITFDDDSETIIYEKDNLHGNGGYRHSGNIFNALIDSWLYSGSLFGVEEKFMDVLKLAGVEIDKVDYLNPAVESPDVYAVYMKMEKPLYTDKISKEIISVLEKEAKKQPQQQLAVGVNLWDKNAQDPEFWIKELKEENTYVWTSIPDWVTDTLKKHGIDGIIDSGGKGDGERHTVYIPFAPAQIKSVNNLGMFNPDNPDIYHQNAANGTPKGAFMNKFNGRALISLFENADASTFMHESAHFFLHEINEYAKFSPQSAKMLDSINHYLQAENGQYTTEQTELFARGFEQFLREGKAPGNYLKQVFTSFMEWLRQIYKTALDLKAPISEEIRETYRRMLGARDLDYYLQAPAAEIIGYNYDRFQAQRKDITEMYLSFANSKARNRKQEIKDNIGNLYDDMRDFLQDSLVPAEDVINQIAPALAVKNRKLEIAKLRNRKIYLDKINPFITKLSKLPSTDFYILDMALKNRDTQVVNEITTKYEMSQEFKNVRELLADLRKQMIEAGIEVGYLEDYFPRRIADARGLVGYVEEQAKQDKGGSFILQALQERRKSGYLSPEDEAQIVNSLIRGFSGKITMANIGEVKSRYIDLIDDKLNKYYKTAGDALVEYVSGVTELVENKKYFGRESQEVRELRARIRRRTRTLNAFLGMTAAEAKWKELKKRNYEIGGLEAKIRNTFDDYARKILIERKNKLINEVEILKNRRAEYVKKLAIERMRTELTPLQEELAGKAYNTIEESVGALLLDMVEKGQIDSYQEERLKDMLVARFSNRGLGNEFMRLIRDGGYIGTLGNLESALTQIGDVGLSAYQNGLWNTAFEYVKAWRGKSEITLQDLGLDKVIKETANMDVSALSTALDKVLKYSGFEKMDKIAKQTLVNAAVNKARKDAKTDKAELSEYLAREFGEQAGLVKQDLIAGKITPEIIEYAMFKLMDVQPVVIDQMPRFYAEGGKKRMFYMMKSYFIKQLNEYRKIVFETGRKNPKKALKDMLLLSAYLLLFNGGADLLKDLFFNRIIKVSDLLINNIFMGGAVGKYQGLKLKREGLSGVVEDFLMPPVIIDSIITDIANFRNLREWKTWKDVPLVGRPYYWYLGGGYLKQQKEQQRELNRKRKRARQRQRRGEN